MTKMNKYNTDSSDKYPGGVFQPNFQEEKIIQEF